MKLAEAFFTLVNLSRILHLFTDASNKKGLNLNVHVYMDYLHFYLCYIMAL